MTTFQYSKPVSFFSKLSVEKNKYSNLITTTKEHTKKVKRKRKTKMTPNDADADDSNRNKRLLSINCRNEKW